MLFDFILITVISICFITDLRYQKIYNRIIFPSLAAALLLHVIIGGYSGLRLSLFGLVTGLCILLIPYLLGGFGAGDVKLLALIGAIKGASFAVNTAIYMALIGGGIALIIILLHKETINFVKGLFIWIFSLSRGINYKLELPTSVFLKKYPYGIAITAGAVICLMFRGAWIV